MAEKKATLVLELKDLASKGLKAFDGALEGLASSALGVSLTISGLLAVVLESIDAFAEQEKAVARLGNALKNQGDASAQTRDDLVAYAGELQKVTTFSDDVLIENQALLVSFGLMGDELKGALGAAMDLSIARNVDLATASMLVGKAYQGNVETLKRYGIEIDGTIPPAERFQAVLNAINGNFGGAAAAAADTYAGRLTILKHKFDELKETAGEQLIPVAEKVVDVTNRSVDGWSKSIGPLTAMKIAYDKVVEAGKAFIALGAGNPDRPRPKPGVPSASAPPPPKVPVDEEGLKLAETTRQRLELQRAGEVERIGIEAEFMAQRLEAHGQFEMAKEVRAQATYDTLAAQRTAEAEDEKRKLEARKHAMTTTFSYLSTLQQSKNKEMVAVGRTAATAQATIDTYAAATAAYRALSGIPIVGPVLGAAAAASIMTAGLANVARINAVQMAEGGVVMPRAGGTLANVGEAGQAEAIIPLGDKRAQQMLGGGGGASIVIQAGTIVADPMSVREFAQRIDNELFRLQRNRKSDL